MKALLAKNKKKLDDKKVKTEVPKEQQPKEDETPNSKDVPKNATNDQDSDSAESESDIIAKRAQDAKFKEAKEETEKDNQKKELGEVLQDNKTKEAKPEKKVFGQGPMNFSRPPKFSNKKPGKFADGEFASLD